jgi:hypothetical protein
MNFCNLPDDILLIISLHVYFRNLCKFTVDFYKRHESFFQIQRKKNNIVVYNDKDYRIFWEIERFVDLSPWEQEQGHPNYKDQYSLLEKFNKYDQEEQIRELINYNHKMYKSVSNKYENYARLNETDYQNYIENDIYEKFGGQEVIVSIIVLDLKKNQFGEPSDCNNHVQLSIGGQTISCVKPGVDWLA